MRRLVPAAEFAEMRGRTVRSVYDARYRGSDLPLAITIGGRLYFAREDIDDWIDDKRQASRLEMVEREQALSRGVERAEPNGRRPQKSSEPRAFERASGLASL